MSGVAPSIVLVGPMGAGKTSVGRRVARALKRPFLDTDKIITRDHGPIPAYFEAHGEAAFRAIERVAVAEALTTGGVIALGGGAVLHEETRADLARHRVVLLTVAPHIVASRIVGDDRPLLAGDDPIARWNRIYDERRALYERVADLTLDTSHGPLSDVVERIVAWDRARQTEGSPS
ncbi:MAG: shikimate kinase [Microbacterium sp.]|uniref:Shikimate kinase n=1 Tax=Microbacterium ginsengisoli TaxID=400772 RepID=A0A3C1KF60_9MICO|nr:shikimate kinase [uncultured Microbacterium sp.]MAL07497.1 shikimate kinase [Microbacterium sp.]MBN9208933.1 shikimate kinase [Microbacterium ginsengisoli]HAN25133.1 shikimate kinase [Microbacterium ginsengisoli]